MQSKLAILVAIVMGIIAAVLIHFYLTKEQPKMISVYRVTKDLPKGSVLKESNCEQVQIPEYAFSRRLHVTGSRFNDIAGKTLTVDYKKGDFVSVGDFVSGVSSSQAMVPEVDKRVVPVPLSMWGNVQEGEFADLVVVSRAGWQAATPGSTDGGAPAAPAAVNRQEQIVTILQKVYVEKLVGRAAASGEDESAPRVYGVAYIQLSKDQAFAFHVYSGTARVALLPRNPNEMASKEIIEFTVSGSSLKTAIEKAAEAINAANAKATAAPGTE